MPTPSSPRRRVQPRAIATLALPLTPGATSLGTFTNDSRGETSMLRKLTQATLMGALAVTCFTASAQAGWIIGLIDGKSIVTIDPATRKVTGKIDIKGAANVIGIDVRPADGSLYGLT